MGRLVKMTLPVILVIFSSTLLCVTVPTPILLESFLTTIGVLFITGMWWLLMKEASKIMDLKHLIRTQQELREFELQQQKKKHWLQVQRRTATRARGYYH
jgi:hypothetical protein